MSYGLYNSYGDRMIVITGTHEHRVTDLKSALAQLERTGKGSMKFDNIDFRRDGAGLYIRNTNTNLAGVDFGSHMLYGCYFNECILTGCNFGADITYSKFDNSDLRGATFAPGHIISHTSFIFAKVDVSFIPPCGMVVHDGRVVRQCRVCMDRPESCLGQGHCTTCCRLRYTICSRCRYHTSVASSRTACEFCRGCESCCVCSRDQESFRVHPHKKGDTFNHKRTCGVEWEVNSHTGLMNTWSESCGGTVHSDGSCGYEAVTPPVAGDSIERVIGDLGEALNESGTAADGRCGIHVHVDAGDYTWADMYTLLALYAKVEPMLYILGGQGRWKSEYAPNCGQMYAEALTEDDRKAAVLGVALTDRPYTGKGLGNRGKEDQRGRPGKKGSGRYKGINILPWLNGRMFRKRDLTPCRKDSTVEFRLHRNTMDAKRVIGWAQLCVCMLDWAATHTEKDVQALPESALRALCVIAPELKQWIVDRVLSWRRATSKRVTRKPISSTRTINLRKGVYKCVA